MKANHVNELSRHGVFHGKPLNGTVESTHISWVLLTKKFVFKIKKPVKLPFLDFSTRQKRKYFCEREVELNSRFSTIYLGVVGIYFTAGVWHIGSKNGRSIDYAVQMRRMMTSKRMDNLLGKRKVVLENIKALAKSVANFHKQAKIIDKPFDLQKAQATFNDLGTVTHWVKKHLGNEFANIISDSIQWSDDFLQEYSQRFQERSDEGFVRDVHGDLHAGNIFLYKNPVLFDCIEFNDEFRQIDVLYEVAFLCMDIESFQQRSLANKFLQTYLHEFKCVRARADRELLLYYKCLRANIRLKVHVASASQSDDPEISEHVVQAKKYLVLIRQYSGVIH